MAAARELPPGVYFNPGPEECVRDYLVPWIRGADLPEKGTFIFEEDIYGRSPDALRRMRPPGTARAFDPKWYFFSHCKVTGNRACRAVAGGGSWKLEQRSKNLEAADDGDAGVRRSFGFYVGQKEKEKTPWLMEEFRSDEGGGGGEGEAEVPVLCRIYVSPRASNDEKRAILGEGGVAEDGKKKKTTTRVVLHEAYFDALADLLPASCRHQGQAVPQPAVLGQHHVQGPPPFPDVHGHQHGEGALPPPPDLADHHHGQYAPRPVVPGHHQDQAAASPPVNLGRHRRHAVLLQAALDQQPGSPLPLTPPSPPAFPHHYLPAPPSPHDPQQYEEAIRAGKKARLACYDAAVLQPQDMAAPLPMPCEVLQEPEPAPPPPTPPPPPPPPEENPALDAPQQAGNEPEPLRGGFMDGADLIWQNFDRDGLDFQTLFEIYPTPFDDAPLPDPDICFSHFNDLAAV